MALEVTKFDIEGPLLIHGVRHHDERGYFSETYQAEKFAELGLPTFVQDNLSKSSRGVFRGLHWQAAPHAQGKLVTCLAGSIVDFVVDVRESSTTFMNFLAVDLTAHELKSLWVPEGFAHGFLSTESETLVHYKVTSPWVKDSERSLNFSVLDKKYFEEFEKVVMSGKDQAAPNKFN